MNDATNQTRLDGILLMIHRCRRSVLLLIDILCSNVMLIDRNLLDRLEERRRGRVGDAFDGVNHHDIIASCGPVNKAPNAQASKQNAEEDET